MTQDKKTEDEMRMREFWIYQDIRDHITEHFPDVAEWNQNFIDDDLLHKPEIVHVIEYSAFQKLRDENEALRGALKQIASTSDEFSWSREQVAREVLAKYQREKHEA